MKSASSNTHTELDQPDARYVILRTDSTTEIRVDKILYN
jgi:hypothetical protein